MKKAARLSKRIWLDAGLEALGQQGFYSLKADIMVKQLNVTRGSFYWHFKDVKAFHEAVVDHWQHTATDAIIRQTEQLDQLVESLALLLEKAFSAPSQVETQMRAWASQYPYAESAVSAVDKKRQAYLLQLLRRTGLTQKVAELRSEIIYWSYLGACFSDSKPQGEHLQDVLTELVSFACGVGNRGSGKDEVGLVGDVQI